MPNSSSIQQSAQKKIITKKLIVVFILFLIIICGVLLSQKVSNPIDKIISIKYCEKNPWGGKDKCVTIDTGISLPIDSQEKAESLLKELKGGKVTILREDENFWYYDDTEMGGTSWAGCRGTINKKIGEVIDNLCIHSTP